MSRLVIHKEDIPEDDIGWGDEVNRITTFLVLNRFNDYDIGMLVMHTIGLITKEKKLLLGKENYQQVFLEELYKIRLFSEHAVSTLQKKNDLSYIIFNATIGEYSYVIKTDDEYIEDLFDRDNEPNKNKDVVIHACKHGIQSKNEKLIMVGFGSLARITLSENDFSELILSTIISINKKQIINDYISNNAALKILSMHSDVLT